MIEIREVKTPKDKKAFVTYPFTLYKNNKYYVPSLRMDENRIFDSRCDYWEVTENAFFLAYKDGELVGRIHGIIQKQYNEIYNTKVVRFTRFDSINDQEVANALFDAVIAWGKSKNMDTIVGPLGFSDLEREGLLIQGFDEKQTYAEQYNYSYYQPLIEKYGFEKDIDWLEFNLTKKEDLDPRLFEMGDQILKKYDLRVVPIKGVSKGKYFKSYYKKFFHLLDVAYKKLYGVVPSTPKLEDNLVKTLGTFIPKKHFRLIVDKNDDLVAFALMMPNLSDALRKSKGRITIPFIFRVLKAMRKPKMVDFMLIGVHPDYLNKAIPSIFLKYIYPMFDEGVESFETNLNLESNHEIMNCWKYFDARHHKRRRCFKKSIGE